MPAPYFFLRTTGTNEKNAKVEDLANGINAPLKSLFDDIVGVDGRVSAVEGTAISGVTRKEAAACATTANITLSGEQTIDGVATSASRVLVKNQSTAAENGIYVSASGAWSRAADMDAAGEVQGAAVYVTGGTAGAGKTFYTGSEVSTLGTDAIAWVVSEDQGALQAEVARKANKEQIDAYEQIPHPRAEFVLTDDDGNEVARVDASRIDHPLIHQMEKSIEESAAKVVPISNDASGRSSFAIVDGDGNLICEIDADHIRHPSISGSGADAAGSKASSVRTSRVFEPRDSIWDSIQLLSGVAMAACMGQSNSHGNDATPVISTFGSDWAKMFIGGVRPNDARTTPIRGAFTALSEFANGTIGETSASGAAKAFSQFMLDEEGVDLSADEAAMFFANHSAPGATIEAGIASGTTAFNDMAQSMNLGSSVANTAGQPFSVAALLLDIGESNQNNGTTQAAYVTLNTTLRSDLEAQAQTYGLARPLPVFINQMNTIVPGPTPAPVDGSVVPAIALAQLQLAQEQDYFCLVGPSYHIPYVSLSNIHYSAYGQLLKGAYLGRAMKRWLVDGIKPRPVAPLSAWKQGNFVMVKMDIQSRTPLVIDNAAFPDVQDSGVQIVDSGGTALTINSITVAWGDTLVIEVASGTPATFRYGWIGVTDGSNLGKLQGCVRDSEGDHEIFDPAGAAYPLHNWLVACEETIL
ncbi:MULTISPECIES: hypothetical protein [unclassified Sulfitobacter]|uniref:hypothetical protein n=2 Tax=Sulfitobacter TaxID=60136 RepID=UPI0007C319E0|nr:MULTISPECIES: hypothetical protein [unclassified Sulfitobacter]KZX98057.1 hypothetical protein A3721_06845 [Sulfitobacter sp. HI0023]KZY26826.1 hypothetical protein A3728_14750 [Sulfitobacter sp. HI0040]KZZ67319.1 hypothetical protein A3764_15240 [Sulfitobacter sp. HI0129]